MCMLDDLAAGLVNKKNLHTFSSVRANSFNEQCAHLYKALLPFLKNTPIGLIHITLLDQTPMTISETAQGVVLAIDGHEVLLSNFTLHMLFEKLYQPVYPDANAVWLHHTYAERVY